MPTPNEYADHAQLDADAAALSALHAQQDADAAYTAAALEVAVYWDFTTSQFKAWDGNSWEIVGVDTFNHLANGGTSSSLVDTIRLRRDTDAAWIINNPILALSEVGWVTDTKLFKVGDGTSTWNVLTYPITDISRITGLENVDNTADTDKPVSTLQAAADTASIVTANAYTDATVIGLIRDRGAYNANITNLFPTDFVLKGDTWNITAAGAGLLIGESIRALVNTPGQTESNWYISPKKSNIINPYIIHIFREGRSVSNMLWLRYIFSIECTFPVNLTLSLAKTRIASTINSVFLIKKNTIQIGTITFIAGNVAGTFLFSNAITFLVGDILEIIAPTISDITLTDISISLYGLR